VIRLARAATRRVRVGLVWPTPAIRLARGQLAGIRLTGPERPVHGLMRLAQGRIRVTAVQAWAGRMGRRTAVRPVRRSRPTPALLIPVRLVSN
jgi:hypothetical protein